MTCTPRPDSARWPGGRGTGGAGLASATAHSTAAARPGLHQPDPHRPPAGPGRRVLQRVGHQFRQHQRDVVAAVGDLPVPQGGPGEVADRPHGGQVPGRHAGGDAREAVRAGRSAGCAPATGYAEPARSAGPRPGGAVVRGLDQGGPAHRLVTDLSQKGTRGTYRASYAVLAQADAIASAFSVCKRLMHVHRTVTLCFIAWVCHRSAASRTQSGGCRPPRGGKRERSCRFRTASPPTRCP